MAQFDEQWIVVLKESPADNERAYSTAYDEAQVSAGIKAAKTRYPDAVVRAIPSDPPLKGWR